MKPQVSTIISALQTGTGQVSRDGPTTAADAASQLLGINLNQYLSAARIQAAGGPSSPEVLAVLTSLPDPLTPGGLQAFAESLIAFNAAALGGDSGI